MATVLHIPGPCVISVNNGSGFVELGYSDNDNLPQVSFTDNHHEVKTVLSGNVPEEIVLTGTSARISVALVKWDNTALAAMLLRVRGAATAGVVGQRIIADANYLGIKIANATAAQVYQFDRCYLQPDSVQDSQWGNRERVLTLAWNAIPNDGALYSLTDV
jgi:hypothetical protein